MREFFGKMALAASSYGKEKDYWLNKLSGEWAKSCFPYDYNKAGINIQGNETDIAYKLDVTDIHFNDQLVEKIIKISKGSDYMLHMILIAGIVALLYKYTCNDDIIVGMPVYKKDIEGQRLNTALVLRNQLNDGLSFKGLLLQVRQTIIDANKNQNYPIETLIYHLNMTFSANNFPLFDVVILLENIHEKKDIIHTCPNIIFSFIKNGNHIDGKIEYHAILYNQETIQRINEYFTRFLEEVIFNMDQPLLSIEILSEEEKEQILYDFNSTQTEFPFDKTIDRLFEEQAAKNPYKIALSDEEGCMAYNVVNERSRRLAVYLQSKGLTLDEAVGVMAENSSGMIVGILGILKAGGGYLPLNSDYPEERRKYILKDGSASKLIILYRHENNVNSYDGVDVICMEDLNFDSITEDPLKKHTPFNLAYIMYTSGSTGNPKGVMIEHKNVIRLVKNTNYIDFKEGDRILQTGALDFDASTFEIWGALLNGLQLHLVRKEVVLTPGMIKSALKKRRITTIWMTSPLFNQLVDEDENTDIFQGLGSLLVGGDVLSPVHINRVRNMLPALKIINGYGPTENTTFSVTHLIGREYKTNIPIGKPIANSKVYILDQQNCLVPIGMFGELCVGGDGLSRGYLNSPELTADKFFRFNKIHLFYKTGDLARWLIDGNIEFLGRIDHQVKIRGYRIEPGEIENQLTRMDNIAEAVLVEGEFGREKYLCAYVVASKNQPLDFVELKNLLLGRMPEYMVPSYFIQMDRIPLNPNGKVDKKSLPEPKLTVGKNYVAPRDHIERSLVSIWSGVLGLETQIIGIDTDFFELGGHSLKATLLTARIHKELNVKIPLAEIFKKPTIRELSIYIKQTTKQSHVAIENVEKKEYYELSSAQKRLYILQQINPAGTTYNVAFGLLLNKNLEKERIKNVMDVLINRHESLRTSFIQVNNEPVQKIWPNPEIKIEYYEVPLGKEIELPHWIKEIAGNFIRPFDLSQAPLIRVGLINEKKKPHILMIDMHHIITDGTSMKLVLKELIDLFAEKKLPPLKFQYKDYSEWQRSDLQIEAIRKQEKYWLSRFEGEIPVLNLPTDYIRPTIQSFEGNKQSFELNEEQSRKLNTLAANTGTTLYILLLAIYNILLSKLSGQHDIIVGTPIAARRHADLEGIIGMFVNTLVMRNYPLGDITTRDFLKEVKITALDAFENQEYPFDDLVNNVEIPRDAGRNPLFDVMFVLQNFYDASAIGKLLEEHRDGLKINPYCFNQEIAKFDLTLFASEQNGKLYFSIEYCTKLFKEENILRFIQYFNKIISSVIKDPGERLSTIEIISEDEKRQILFDFNDTFKDYPKDKSISQLFAEQFEKAPHHTAIFGCGQAWIKKEENKKRSNEEKREKIYLTYKKLNEHANHLAGLLIDKGVELECIAGIMMERSIDLVIGILGILKAGGAYLPIDPDYPQDRINYMLKDSGAGILLTDDVKKKMTTCQLSMSERPPSGLHHSSFDIPRIHHSNLAYVIYTSGSTGRPKGVMVEQGNIVRLVKNTNYISFNSTDRILQSGALEFDASTFEIWGSLLNGLTLYLVKKEEILDAPKLKKAIRNYSITMMWMTSPLFNHMLQIDIEIFLGLNKLLVGGDILSPIHINRLKNRYPHLSVINGYGPTENTTFSTTYLINKEYNGSIPIGKPIDNSTAYIFDKYNNLQPPGIPGELYLGGDGIGRGYLNNSELTREKFVPHPFKVKERVYMTGDLARWLPDGNIEFLGRIDQQIKIRGYRVELGEIESRLLNHHGVKEAVVSAHEEENGNKYTCAYIVFKNESATHDLQEYLAKGLPDYMIPSYFVYLEKMPLTANGKIDHGALPKIGKEINLPKYIAPRDEIEKKLVEIWSNVLGIVEEKIGINDNFFDLGGHSLKATTLLSQIHKEIKVNIPLHEIFKTSHIRGLAEFIKNRKTGKFFSIEPIEKMEYYILSSAQRRLFVLCQLDENSVVYNMPFAHIINSSLDEEAFSRSFEEVVARHEILRTIFIVVNGEPKQKILNSREIGFNVEKIDLRKKLNVNKEEKLQALVFEEVERKFNLHQGPLIIARLMRLEDEKYLFLLNMHHIISDGWSMGILFKEIGLFYDIHINGFGESLPPLRIQYRDFSLWQNKQLDGEAIKLQKEYWLKEFSEKIPILNLPTDYARSSDYSFEGKTVSFNLDKDEVNGLKALAALENVTLYMILFSIFNVLMAKLSGSEDIVLGCSTAGRGHTDLHQLIGMFVNTLAIRCHPENQKIFREFLKEVKDKILNAFENQEYQFEDLVNDLAVHREIGRHPIFDVLFALQNYTEEEIEHSLIKTMDLKLNEFKYEQRTAKFDIMIVGIEIKNDLSFIFSYRTKLFEKETIERFTRYFQKIVSAIIENPGKKIADIEIVSKDTQDKLIEKLKESKEEKFQGNIEKKPGQTEIFNADFEY